jgi:hypothetical protein
MSIVEDSTKSLNIYVAKTKARKTQYNYYSDIKA